MEFTGQIFHLDTGVPGMIIAAVRNGETAVFGFGETAKGSGLTPNAEGSVSKKYAKVI